LQFAQKSQQHKPKIAKEYAFSNALQNEKITKAQQWLKNIGVLVVN